MRITMGIIAALGLGAACGKSNDRGPEPATAQIMKNEAAAPVTPETPSDPDRDRIALAHPHRGKRMCCGDATLVNLAIGEFAQVVDQPDAVGKPYGGRTHPTDQAGPPRAEHPAQRRKGEWTGEAHHPGLGEHPKRSSRITGRSQRGNESHVVA